VPNQPSEADQNRRRRWLLLLLLLVLLLVVALIAFVSCGSSADKPGSAGATPAASRIAVGTFTESPLASPSQAVITVPSVIGMEADAADMKLRDTGFTDISFVDSAGKPAALLQSWVVSKQSVPAGGAVPATQPIVLTVTEKTNGRG